MKRNILKLESLNMQKNPPLLKIKTKQILGVRHASELKDRALILKHSWSKD